MGIVYATEAAITDKVKVVGILPENSHSPIVYQAGILKDNNTRTGQAFYEFLKSPEAAVILNKYGFLIK